MIALLALVAGWSAAEAAIWFLVADIPISWIAVTRGTRAALVAALVAALASAVGGLALWWWTALDPAGATATIAALPGINQAMIIDAADRVGHGPLAVLAGSFGGIPFKLFALEAAKRDWVALFLLAPLVRVPRFLLAATIAGLVSSGLSRWLSVAQRLVLLAAIWTAFYLFYFAVMPR